MSNKPHDALLTTAELAEFIGVERTTLEKWRLEKIGPDYIWISSRCVRYQKSDIAAWIETKKCKP